MAEIVRKRAVLLNGKEISRVNGKPLRELTVGNVTYVFEQSGTRYYVDVKSYENDGGGPVQSAEPMLYNYQVSKRLENWQGSTFVGIMTSTELIEQYGPSVGSAGQVDFIWMLNYLLNIDLSNINPLELTVVQPLPVVGEYMLQYINGDIGLSEVIGKSCILLDIGLVDGKLMATGQYTAVTQSILEKLAQYLDGLKLLDLEFSQLAYISGSDGDYELVEEDFYYSQIYNNNVAVMSAPIIGDSVKSFNFTVVNKFHTDYLEITSFTPPVENKRGLLETTRVTCLTGDTLIDMSDGTRKRLDKLCVGDRIRVITDEWRTGTETVIFTDTHLHKSHTSRAVYTFSDGRTLTVVKDHRVYSEDRKKFVHASELDFGERVLFSDGGHNGTLQGVHLMQEPTRHYTLFTDGGNRYFANGILCGNIFSNIRPHWLRKLLIKFYYRLVLKREL